MPEQISIGMDIAELERAPAPSFDVAGLTKRLTDAVKLMLLPAIVSNPAIRGDLKTLATNAQAAIKDANPGAEDMIRQLELAIDSARQNAPGPLRGFHVIDGAVVAEQQRSVNAFLNRPGWNFGWKSNVVTDQFSFWHKHFAGNVHPDHVGGRQYDCTDDLKRNAPPLRQFWDWLSEGMLAGHRLVRCYANGQPFGAEGTLHTDSVSDLSFTTIYYPHEKWDVNWGGETLFFNRERTDIVAAIYPRPNRLLMFPGTIPHVARGVSRACPVLRITLMFKTELAGLTLGGTSATRTSVILR